MRRHSSEPTHLASTIPSDPFQESVYKLIPKEYIPPPKAERYKSKFAQQARVEYNNNRKSTASMGPAKVQVNHPREFLKKGEKKKDAKHPEFEHDRTIRKAPVPKETGIIPPKTTKDFVKLNALENINSLAKKPSSGPPKYLTKKDYGRTPEYLVKRIESHAEAKARKEKEDQEAYIKSQQVRNGLVLLPEEERVRILEGLKANWEKLNQDYQKLSLTVDTVPKISRKVNMENQLKHLEEHIQKFSHHLVYVDFESVYGNN